MDVETVALTLTIAEQNHADDLKRMCLDFAGRNLEAVMKTDGFKYMKSSCPSLQVRTAELVYSKTPF